MVDSDNFSIQIHHGSQFGISWDGEKNYLGGEITTQKNIDKDKFGYLDLEDEVMKMGYISWSSLSFKIPKSNVYKVLNGDRDVLDMLIFLSRKCNVIDIYVDHGKKSGDDIPITEDTEGAYINDIEKTSVSVEVREQVDGFENALELDVDFEGYNSSEDTDYNPMGESDTDDSMSDGELASEDDEYMKARQIKRNVRATQEKSVLTTHVQYGGSGTSMSSGELSIPVDDGFVSEYDESEGEINSDSSEDERCFGVQGNARRKQRQVTYDPKCDHKSLKLRLGMRFEDGFQCKRVVQRLAIENGYPIRFKRCNKEQCEAYCIPECGWRVYASLVKIDGAVVIKSISDDHKCPRAMDNKQVSSNWIADEYLNKFRVNPNWPVKELKADIMERFACEVTKWKLYDAKFKALKKLRGSVTEHYAKLRSYIAELIRVDKDGRFELWLGEASVFKGLYVGFSSLKKGFIKGCRPIIGFDGCFLKTSLGGVLLCAVTKDANNQMYPIAWAVAAVENEECWTWFLTILFEELGINDGLGYSFISDQQKGLINAVSKLTPFAEHRNCARHVYCNWKKQFKGPTLKNLFWRACRSTYVQSYKLILEELKAENEAAYTNFLERDPQKFCKAFISTTPVCDMIDNNISETFNAFIVVAREKHVIDMLEDIKNALMKRECTKLDYISGVNDKVCPRIRQKIEKRKFDSRFCTVHPASGGKFQVLLQDDQFVVNVGSRSCTCRTWDLSGIPCVHACSAINFLRRDPADFVHRYYLIESYIETYRFGLEPCNGPKMWPYVPGEPVQPPMVRRMPGRQKKKRRRTVEEKEDAKSIRFPMQMTCRKCLQPGHNIRTCKQEAVVKPPAANARRGRPPKSKENDSRPKRTVGKRTHQQPHVESTIFKERALVKKGYGVCTFEESGHIYTRMPNEKRIHFVNPSAWKSNSNIRFGGKKKQVEHVSEMSSSSEKVLELPTQESRN